MIFPGAIVSGVMGAMNKHNAMREEYSAYLSTTEDDPHKTYEEYHAIYFAEMERQRQLREAKEIADAGRPRNIIETLLGG